MDHSPSVVLFESIQKQALQVKGDFQGGDKKQLEQVAVLAALRCAAMPCAVLPPRQPGSQARGAAGPA